MGSESIHTAQFQLGWSGRGRSALSWACWAPDITTSLVWSRPVTRNSRGPFIGYCPAAWYWLTRLE